MAYIDILANKEYNYIYENGILVRTTESDVVLNVNGYVVSKNLVNTITYTYNADDQLVKKLVISAFFAIY